MITLPAEQLVAARGIDAAFLASFKSQNEPPETQPFDSHLRYDTTAPAEENDEAAQITEHDSISPSTQSTDSRESKDEPDQTAESEPTDSSSDNHAERSDDSTEAASDDQPNQDESEARPVAIAIDASQVIETDQDGKPDAEPTRLKSSEPVTATKLVKSDTPINDAVQKTDHRTTVVVEPTEPEEAIVRHETPIDVQPNNTQSKDTKNDQTAAAVAVDELDDSQLKPARQTKTKQPQAKTHESFRPATEQKTSVDGPKLVNDTRSDPAGELASGSAQPHTDTVDVGAAGRFAQHLFNRTGKPTNPPQQIGPADQARFVQRVSRAFEIAQNRDGLVRLRLSPPELGSLRLEVKLQGGAIIARIETETNAARTLLLDNLPVLRERLAEQGIRIEQFQVDVPDRQTRNSADTPFDAQQNSGRRPKDSSSAPSGNTDDDDVRGGTRQDNAANGLGQLNVII